MADMRDSTHESEPENDRADNAAAQATSTGRGVKKPVWLRLFGHDLAAPLLLLALCLCLFVPGQWTVPPLDRDEPRYTQATKQMLETGDYVDIRFQDQARHKKPVGIYWLQAGAVKASGYGADAPLWVYRLPSLIGATLSVLAAFWLARAFMGPAGALVAASFVAAAIILGVEARLAKTDAMMFATVVIAQGALARIWLKEADRRLWGLAAIFWTALAASVLIKGPVGLMVVGFTIAGLMIVRRKVAWFKAASPVLGLIWFLLLISPWFIAIWIATDGAFFAEAIGRDLLGKVGEGQESHGAPPLTHLGAMFGVFWPLPAFLLVSLPLIWRERKSPLVVFAACWFFPSWIVFELVATKLPHYTMPLLPALALPVAAALMEGGGAHSARWLRWVAAVLLAVPAVGLAVASFGGPVFLGLWPSPPGAIVAAIGGALGLVAAARLLRGPALYAVPLAILSAIAITIGVWGFTGPALQTIWVSPRLVAAADEIAGCADTNSRSVVTSGFHEPSYIFLEGTGTQIISAQGAAQFLYDGLRAQEASCRIAAVESRQEARFLAAAEEIGLVVVARKRVDGLNINGGDEVDIALYQSAADETGASDSNEQQ